MNCSVGEEVVDEDRLCVVCYARLIDTKLRPCGHEYFCRTCAQHFRTCPLCRSPLEVPQIPVGTTNSMHSSDTTPAETVTPLWDRVVSPDQQSRFRILLIVVWFFMLILGWLELYSYDPCCPEEGEKCNFNVQGHCYERLEDLPPMTSGGVLGETLYFSLIVIVQVSGCLYEMYLIYKLKRQNLLPGKELFVLILALLAEVIRMLLVDVFVLQQYFSGRTYSIIRRPIAAASGLCGGPEWMGADGLMYCNDTAPYSSETEYYIATRMEDFTMAPQGCSVWTTSSALLDFNTEEQMHFIRLGWVLGGGSAMIYFFAAYVNEIADNLFVIPTSTELGWRIKFFAIALEIFQLGCLLPAAIFSHGDCLYYTDPLNVSLFAIREIVMVCYRVIGLLLISSVLLTLLGLFILAILWVLLNCIGLSASELARRLGHPRTADRITQSLEVTFDEQVRGEPNDPEGPFMRIFQIQRDFLAEGHTREQAANVLYAIMVPMLPLFILVGLFLGTLVVVGQFSKEGAMEKLTAAFLLLDVLVKVGLTMVTEAIDYALHVRVRRAVSRREHALPSHESPSESLGEPTQPNPEVLGEPTQPSPEVLGAITAPPRNNEM